jgi:hypothetical protein
MKDETITGHSISFDEKRLPSNPAPAKEAVDAPEKTAVAPESFEAVFRRYASVMRTYRNFLALTLELVPAISNTLSDKRISEFAKQRGAKRTDLTNADRTVFELPMHSFQEFMMQHREIRAAMDGAKHLPEVMIIGLVSAYDAFLSQLVRVVFDLNPGIVFTSDKSIKFSDLVAYKDMNAARDALIDREIESLIRESHHQQFASLEEKLTMKLREGLSVWPKFIELCERRNLLTHTGGIVSHQYLTNCSNHKFDVTQIAVGDRLRIDSAYFAEAVRVMTEIGMKLCYVFWRKFGKGQRDDADSALSDECYNLIAGGDYATAEAILSFGCDVLKKSGSDRTRRMMIINLANALRLQKKVTNARKLLDGEDWGAVNDEFAISVAAVREDVSTVVALMRRIGRAGRPDIEDYRTWPVFRGMRTDPDFQSAFLEVFGEAVIAAPPSNGEETPLVLH